MITEYQPEVHAAPLEHDAAGKEVDRVQGYWPKPGDNRMLLYRADDGRWVWAVFQCPCECGHNVHLPLEGNRSSGYPAKWKLTLDDKGRATIRASVQRRVPCQAHFFITENRTEMC